MNTLILDKLFETTFPSNWSLGHLPLESNSLKLGLAFFGQARSLLGTLGAHSSSLEVGLCKE